MKFSEISIDKPKFSNHPGNKPQLANSKCASALVRLQAIPIEYSITASEVNVRGYRGQTSNGLELLRKHWQLEELVRTKGKALLKTVCRDYNG